MKNFSFKTSHIRKKPSAFSIFLKTILSKPPWLTIFGVVIIFVFLGYSTLKFISNIDISSIFSFVTGVVGKDLAIDKTGHTNFLILGTGGAGHEGPDLTDSVILASIDHETKSVSLLSVPRDLFIETQEVGGNRINRLYELSKAKFGEEKALNFVKKTLSATLNVDIQYGIRVDFKGFEMFIDQLGGIDIYVEKAIEDPFYPKEGTLDYEPFFLAAGNRHLDGKTALKYVRSRKTTSDFDRSKRQQQVMVAIRKKALEKDIIKSPKKLKALYNSVSGHIGTNMDLREMITLAGMAPLFSEERIFAYSLNDDPTQTGGFLYTPVRELYGGAFVLLPATDKFTEVQRFTNSILNYGASLHELPSIQVLNGTKQNGLAYVTKGILNRYGFNITDFGNARTQDIKETTIYYKLIKQSEILDVLKKIIEAKVTEDIPDEYKEKDAQIIIELGENFIPQFNILDIFRNIVEIKPNKSSDATPVSVPQSESAAGAQP